MSVIRELRQASGQDLAYRAARLLLALHVAGERGILLSDLIERVGASRATVYRDIRRVQNAGWRLRTRRPRGIGHQGH